MHHDVIPWTRPFWLAQDTFIGIRPTCQSFHWDIPNNHPFEFFRASNSRVHAKPFTTYVLNSKRIIQPLIHGLGHNIDTCVIWYYPWKSIFKGRCSRHSPMMWHTYVPHGSSHRPHGPKVVESQHHASPYNTFWDIFNHSRADVILASEHMTSCIVHQVSNSHQI